MYTQSHSSVKKLESTERLFLIWATLALITLLPVTQLLNGSFPILTILWLVVPLFSVMRSNDARQVGFRPLPWKELAWVTAANLAGLLLIMLCVEPWSHTYARLLELALANQPPDTTFAWLLRYPGADGWTYMLFYTGLVTLFGEELFFRGWLLQTLQKRMKTIWAIMLQAALFVIPNLLAALFLAPLQGVLYIVVYTWLAIGVVGGWAAARTRSIWPSLISATFCNLLLTFFILGK